MIQDTEINFQRNDLKDEREDLDRSDTKRQKFETQVSVRSDKQDLVSLVEEIIDVCSNFGSLENPKAFSNRNASSSSQVLAMLQGKKVFLKIFTDTSMGKSDGILQNGLLVEAAIYFCGIAKLIPTCCPFFIKPIAYQECDGFVMRLKSLIATKDKSLQPLKTQAKKIIDRLDKDLTKMASETVHTEKERSYIVINEQFLEEDVPMDEWLKTPRDLASYQAVYFEILWTLLCLEKVGIKHNDFHLQNIYIRTLENSRLFPFFFNFNNQARTVYLETKLQVLIFDFDQSTIPGLTNNASVQRQAEFGFRTQEANFGYDLTRLVCFSRINLTKTMKENTKALGKKNITNPDTLRIQETNKAIDSTLKFLDQFYVIQGKDFSGFKEDKKSFGGFCILPPKKVLLTNLKEQGYPQNFISGLEFVGEELKYDYNYARILSTDNFFEPIRSLKMQSLKPLDSPTYSLPSEEIKNDIYSCIRKSFPQVLLQ